MKKLITTGVLAVFIGSLIFVDGAAQADPAVYTVPSPTIAAIDVETGENVYLQGTNGEPWSAYIKTCDKKLKYGSNDTYETVCEENTVESWGHFKSVHPDVFYLKPGDERGQGKLSSEAVISLVIPAYDPGFGHGEYQYGAYKYAVSVDPTVEKVITLTVDPVSGKFKIDPSSNVDQSSFIFDGASQKIVLNLRGEPKPPMVSHVQVLEKGSNQPIAGVVTSAQYCYVWIDWCTDENLRYGGADHFTTDDAGKTDLLHPLFTEGVANLAIYNIKVKEVAQGYKLPVNQSLGIERTYGLGEVWRVTKQQGTDVQMIGPNGPIVMYVEKLPASPVPTFNTTVVSGMNNDVITLTDTTNYRVVGDTGWVSGVRKIRLALTASAAANYSFNGAAEVVTFLD